MIKNGNNNVMSLPRYANVYLGANSIWDFAPPASTSVMFAINPASYTS